MKEEFSLVVDLHDTDFQGLMRPSALLRSMQNATNAQMRRFDIDPSQLLAKTGRAFLLSSLALRVYAPIYAYDRLCAQAWPTESRGFRFLRNGQVTRDGTVVAEMTTVWAFVHAQSRTLLRVSDFDAPFDTSPALELPAASRVAFPRDAEFVLSGSYPVLYRDVDLHRHMNNTVYPDLLCSALPLQEGKRLSELDLLYQKEAPLGDCLQTFYTAAEGDYFLKTVRSDGEENVRARIRLTDVK